MKIYDKYNGVKYKNNNLLKIMKKMEKKYYLCKI